MMILNWKKPFSLKKIQGCKGQGISSHGKTYDCPRSKLRYPSSGVGSEEPSISNDMHVCSPIMFRAAVMLVVSSSSDNR